MSEGNRLDDVYHVTRDEQYELQLQAEAEYWGRPQPFSLLDLDMPVICGYLNEQFTGSKDRLWYEAIPRHGDFRRGCALGAGVIGHEAHILAQNPALHITFYDASAEALAERERELGARFPGRVTTALIDLNFDALPADAYDLVFSQASMHHILNLEHVAYQINRSLTLGGHVFLLDYVGEPRFQFVAEKKRLFEALLDEAKLRHPVLGSWQLAWTDPERWEDYSPFEAVRPDETLTIFRRYLDQIDLRAAGSLVLLMLWLRPRGQASDPRSHRSLWQRALRFASRVSGRAKPSLASHDLLALMREVAPEFVPLDRALSTAGLLQPMVASAVYRKRRAS